MKTKISQIAAAAFFALFIFAGNANAKGTDFFASGHENNETTLELESWMVTDSYWETGDLSAFGKANEKALKLECWMVNSSVWETGNKVTIETEKDQNLDIEPWMTDEEIWN